ncbi:MAG: hypothetical protein Q7R35_17255 [Elusimicrobiota bacterium]|nr:hypothetical protein [Elusimicrobiota bacterium]
MENNNRKEAQEAQLFRALHITAETQRSQSTERDVLILLCDLCASAVKSDSALFAHFCGYNK